MAATLSSVCKALLFILSLISEGSQVSVSGVLGHVSWGPFPSIAPTPAKTGALPLSSPSLQPLS